MYTTCLFCHAPLGANEVVGAFPVGRRLAFDAAKGRLWVVCRTCERWNLTPLEERWEAIENCEREFGAARLRASTDNIGMAKLREGLELVRIGVPQRPEMAAWRYGDQFGRRRRAMLMRGGVAAAGLAALGLGLSAAGIGIGGLWWFGHGIYDRVVNGSGDAVIARIPHEGALLKVKRKHLRRSAIVRADDGVHVALRYSGGETELSGPAAVAAARQLLPQANRGGGSTHQVQEAVGLIEHAGDAERAVLDLASTTMPAPPKAGRRGRRGRHGQPFGIDPVRRLALEMALHEEQERRALEGELRVLEAAWRDAEEIAGIADSMFVTESVTTKLDEMRGRKS